MKTKTTKTITFDQSELDDIDWAVDIIIGELDEYQEGNLMVEINILESLLAKLKTTKYDVAF